MTQYRKNRQEGISVGKSKNQIATIQPLDKTNLQANQDHSKHKKNCGPHFNDRSDHFEHITNIAKPGTPSKTRHKLKQHANLFFCFG
jgi:hypothetical protein